MFLGTDEKKNRSTDKYRVAIRVQFKPLDFGRVFQFQKYRQLSFSFFSFDSLYFYGVWE